MAKYNHLKGIPELPDSPNIKKKRPKSVAVVDEDNCTGCQACVPFCPWIVLRQSRKISNIPIPPFRFGLTSV